MVLSVYRDSSHRRMLSIIVGRVGASRFIAVTVVDVHHPVFGVDPCDRNVAAVQCVLDAERKVRAVERQQDLYVGVGARARRPRVPLVDWRDERRRHAFQDGVRRAAGWLGFHVSGFGTNAWPWFTEFMGGGRFSANNWPSMPARVNADDPAHPILKGVPATFVAPINEWYRGRRARAPTPTSRSC